MITEYNLNNKKYPTNISTAFVLEEYHLLYQIGITSKAIDILFFINSDIHKYTHNPPLIPENWILGRLQQ